jgi:hypothetical protein
LKLERRFASEREGGAGVCGIKNGKFGTAQLAYASILQTFPKVAQNRRTQ